MESNVVDTTAPQTRNIMVSGTKFGDEPTILFPKISVKCIVCNMIHPVGFIHAVVAHALCDRFCGHDNVRMCLCIVHPAHGLNYCDSSVSP